MCCRGFSNDDCFLPVGFILDETGRKVLPLDIIVKGMALGTVMYKVKGVKKWYKRRYKVDLNNMVIQYQPTHKAFWKEKDDTINIYDIQEVREGWRSDVFNDMAARFRRGSLRSAIYSNLSAALKEQNCFTLIVPSKHKVVDLIAPNMHTRDAWVRGLNHLITTCKNSYRDQELVRWLKDQFRNADRNNNGCLNFEECLGLLNQMNISMDKKDVRTLFHSANFKKYKIDEEDALDAQEFVQFYHSLTRRPELEQLMKKHSVTRTTIMGVEELQLFLTKEQKIPCNLAEAAAIIKKYENESEAPDKAKGDFLTLKGFQRMLLSVDHDIFNKKHKNVYQDMSQPLNYYYISTSHNTYLLSDQLIGNSSIEGYIEALLRGCRCLELDTWDGPDGEPIVFHGYTLTSRIFLRDILVSIREYAFKTSSYPVILSIENHCGLSYQVKMAEHFVNILGDFLYTKPVDENETTFPSPEALLYKILLKAKKIKETAATEEVYLLEEEVEQEQILASSLNVATALETSEAPLVVGKLAPQLSNLVNYFVPVRFDNFQETKNWKFQEMTSFSEVKALNLCREESQEFVAYNKVHFSRIYPKGTRADSSNYDAIQFWNVGCQLIALNYQTWDHFMRVNEAKFAQNGKCGYILKPPFLRDENSLYDPNEPPDKSLMRVAIIRIISGQHIPKPNRAKTGEVVDPYVVVKVTGHHGDVQKKKTNFVMNNGFNPMWNEMFLLTVLVPELAMVTFTVKDQNYGGKNEVLGQYSLPFTSITEGYRHIHLLDDTNRSLSPATLFIHVIIGTEATMSVFKTNSDAPKSQTC